MKGDFNLVERETVVPLMLCPQRFLYDSKVTSSGFNPWGDMVVVGPTYTIVMEHIGCDRFEVPDGQVEHPHNLNYLNT